MAEVNIKIGGFSFEVSCATGEETFLKEAAAHFDRCAKHVGPLSSKERVLLMGGLILADELLNLKLKLSAIKSFMSKTPTGSEKSPSSSEAFYGSDKRSAEDYKLWAKVDDPNAPENERRAALDKIISRESHRSRATAG